MERNQVIDIKFQSILEAFVEYGFKTVVLTNSCVPNKLGLHI